MKFKKITKVTNGLRNRRVVQQEYYGSLKDKKTTYPRRLKRSFKRSFGINNLGRRTSTNKRGFRMKYLLIDFKRDLFDIFGTVIKIQKDFNRNADVALISYSNGEKRFILYPDQLKLGDKVISYSEEPKEELLVGFTAKLKYIQKGVSIHNLSMMPINVNLTFMVRSAGTFATIVSKDDECAIIKLPSKILRKFSLDCSATLGRVGNSEFFLNRMGKAGRNFHRGRKSHVRGSAMNISDHPHGGGRGRTGIGRIPVNPSGRIKKGTKTATKRNYTQKFLLKQKPKTSKRK